MKQIPKRNLLCGLIFASCLLNSCAHKIEIVYKDVPADCTVMTKEQEAQMYKDLADCKEDLTECLENN